MPRHKLPDHLRTTGHGVSLLPCDTAWLDSTYVGMTRSEQIRSAIMDAKCWVAQKKKLLAEPEPHEEGV
jgi:hypothetical protein